ncbi:MAG: prepilin-type N-terminal cleavage/methylation domain-containing protein [Phycisphaerales bacterium]|nr:prepilin-type N-terminal cleavage/methylation domain-containing protein [Phycisphaerales bacterium]
MRTNTPARLGFSLVEMLIALTITATLFTATLVALDAAFKGYKHTTEGASTHVVSRIVMTRIMTMVRTGTDFGPYPADPLDASLNPVHSNYIEFVAVNDEENLFQRIVRIERRESEDPTRGPYELWYIQTEFENEVESDRQEVPLLTNLEDVRFTLTYDVGPRLLEATIDLTVKPNDVQDANVGSTLEAPVVRFVSTVAPRKLDEEN